jgi:hypothetical protein
MTFSIALSCRTPTELWQAIDGLQRKLSMEGATLVHLRAQRHDTRAQTEPSCFVCEREPTCLGI